MKNKSLTLIVTLVSILLGSFVFADSEPNYVQAPNFDYNKILGTGDRRDSVVPIMNRGIKLTNGNVVVPTLVYIWDPQSNGTLFKRLFIVCLNEKGDVVTSFAKNGILDLSAAEAVNHTYDLYHNIADFYQMKLETKENGKAEILISVEYSSIPRRYPISPKVVAEIAISEDGAILRKSVKDESGNAIVEKNKK